MFSWNGTDDLMVKIIDNMDKKKSLGYLTLPINRMQLLDDTVVPVNGFLQQESDVVLKEGLLQLMAYVCVTASHRWC